MRRLVLLATTVAVVTLAAAGCGASGGAAVSSPSTAAGTPAGSTQTTSSASPSLTPDSFTDADIVQKVTVDTYDGYNDPHYSGYTDSLKADAVNAVRYQYWGCQKTADQVSVGYVFRLEVGVNGDNGLLPGHDQNDRNPIEANDPQGNGFVWIVGPGPEGSSHYDLLATSPGICKFELDVLSKQVSTGPNLGLPLTHYSGTGNSQVTTPGLTNPWHLQWWYRCVTSSSFVVNDSGMGGRSIVFRTVMSGTGVFDQYDSAGGRTLSVVTGGDCSWWLTLYQGH
jgi:hypothetical protein